MWTDTVVIHSAVHCCFGVQEVVKLFYEAAVEDDRFMSSQCNCHEEQNIQRL